jgi:curved DNA-binding protein
MADYYSILGVDRNASPEQIKQAYRKLASKHHPDRGGDTRSFQEIQKAYEVLSNAGSRSQYDSPGGMFNQGQPGFDFQTIFDMFGARFGQQPGQHPGFRQQARMSLWVTLEDIARGGQRTVSIGTQHGTQTVEIEIPQGMDDGDSVQYPGIGPGNTDLIVTYRIHPNPRYQRQGLNLLQEISVPVWDLILGTVVTVRDILNNSLELTVPPGTQPGTLLRLKSKGLTRRGVTTGDLLIRVNNTVPTNIDPELFSMIEQKYRKSKT